jgi:predicted phosphoribosyltransferase
MRFKDRAQAGRLLAARLKEFENRDDVVVLALPRGGVPVAFEIAQELNAPLDVFVVRKLGLPGQQELAIGAIATGGIRVLNEEIVRYLSIPAEVIDRVAETEQRELERREVEYRDERPAPAVRDHTVILVDDGLATGSTMRAAITALRKLGPARIVVAVPTTPLSTYYELKGEADDVIAVITPEPFDGVGRWYRDFTQTSDAEVRELLERASREHVLIEASRRRSRSSSEATFSEQPINPPDRVGA